MGEQAGALPEASAPHASVQGCHEQMQSHLAGDGCLTLCLARAKTALNFTFGKPQDAC